MMNQDGLIKKMALVYSGFSILVFILPKKN